MLGILPSASQVKGWVKWKTSQHVQRGMAFFLVFDWTLLRYYRKKLLPSVLIDTASGMFPKPRKLKTFLYTTLVFLFKNCSVNFSVPFHTKIFHSFRIFEFSSTLELQAHYKDFIEIFPGKQMWASAQWIYTMFKYTTEFNLWILIFI